MYIEKAIENYPIGGYIRKARLGALFSYTHFGKKNLNAYDKIRTVKVSRKKLVVINGNEFNTAPILISQEEAYKLKDIWDEIQKRPILKSLNIENEHFRLDNGKEKEILLERTAKRFLYNFTMKYPEYKYEIYTCTYCGGIHIGKVLSNG